MSRSTRIFSIVAIVAALGVSGIAWETALTFDAPTAAHHLEWSSGGGAPVAPLAVGQYVGSPYARRSFVYGERLIVPVVERRWPSERFLGIGFIEPASNRARVAWPITDLETDAWNCSQPRVLGYAPIDERSFAIAYEAWGSELGPHAIYFGIAGREGWDVRPMEIVRDGAGDERSELLALSVVEGGVEAVVAPLGRSLDGPTVARITGVGSSARLTKRPDGYCSDCGGVFPDHRYEPRLADRWHEWDTDRLVMNNGTAVVDHVRDKNNTIVHGSPTGMPVYTTAVAPDYTALRVGFSPTTMRTVLREHEPSTFNAGVFLPRTGGYFWTTGIGEYISLDYQLNRTDPLTLREHLRQTASSSTGEAWFRELRLGWALFGLPLCALAGLASGLIRRRPGQRWSAVPLCALAGVFAMTGGWALAQLFALL